MTSVCEAWSMRCPKCGDDGELCITVEIQVALSPDGTEDVDGDRIWTSDSVCICALCRFESIVDAFEVDDADEEEVAP